MASWYQTSRSGCQSMSPPVRLTVSTVCTLGHWLTASSVCFLSSTFLPPRTPSSAVMTTRQSESRMRSFRDSAEKPPKTTECTAPMRAQASMA